MFLLPLVFIAAIALTIWFVVASDASPFTKVLIAVLFGASLMCRNTRFALAGFFVQVVLGIFVLLYRRARPQ